MVYAAIGGMQLKRWTGYFKIIMPTLRVLRQAKQTDGCVHADTFKSGDAYFAVSVWDSKEDMQAFARGGLHGTLTHIAMGEMELFFNHTEGFDTVPSRTDSVSAGKVAIADRGGQGTVGRYS